MAAIPRSYKKNIAEGNGILIFSIFFAVIIRIIYLLRFNIVETTGTMGYLWEPLSPLLENPYISLATSSVFTAGLAFLAAHINTQHVLIRRKTLLPPALIILLFSCQPSFIVMSAEYISVLFFLVIALMLFSSYHSEHKQNASFKTSFVLALGSMFVPVSLVYIPILWIALTIMRCFGFKSFLASLVGIFVIYLPAFSFYLLTDNLDRFLEPFLSVNIQNLNSLPIFSYSIAEWIILGFSVILLTVIISDDFINRHKDKIRIRAYLNLLLFVSTLATLFYLFFNVNPKAHLFIAMASGALLLSHFFALAEKKVTVVLFYISIVFYIVISFSPFLSI